MRGDLVNFGFICPLNLRFPWMSDLKNEHPDNYMTSPVFDFWCPQNRRYHNSQKNLNPSMLVHIPGN